jgi:hypothetical protein
MVSTGSNSSTLTVDVAPDARADVVVGLTTYNDVRTAAAVAAAAREGLARYFGSRPARIVLADGGSTDGTREAVRDQLGDALLLIETPGATLAELPYHGHPARATGVRAILQAAQRMGATVCAIVDPRLETATPDAVQRLVSPVLEEQLDFVSPHYARRMNEGAITRGIVYPAFRALYGVRLRQPAAGEFACSARVVSRFLGETFWDAEHAHAGIDLWLSAAAVTADVRVGEVAFGARRAAPVEPPLDLSTTLAQIAGALFADLEHRADFWQRTRRSTPVALVGDTPTSDAMLAPAPVAVDAQRYLESFRLGYRELREIWTWVLPPRTIVELRRLTALPPERFRFDNRLWATIIYDFALGFSLRVLPADHLLRSLTPLYSGWLASFVLQLEGATPDAVDAQVEQVCLAFEAEKRYLIARWRWPERLR